MYKIIGADGKEYGPVSLETLRQWMAEGRANSETKVLPEGATEWRKAGELPELTQPTPAAPAQPATLPPGPGPISPPPTAPRTNPLAITGLILGIISMTVGLCCYGLPFNVAGIICSAVAMVQIKNDPQRESGHGIALAGLVLSILSLVFAGLMLIFYFSFGTSRLFRHMHRF